MKNSPTILIADDDQAICDILEEAIRQEGWNPRVMPNGEALLMNVKAGLGDAVITDILMPNENGLDLLPRIHAINPHIPVVVMSAQSTLSHTVQANQRGAYEFIAKPFDLEDLINTIRKSLANQDNQPNHALTKTDTNHELLVGQSPKMQELYRMLARVVNLDLTVLVVGESGTGKEVVARALHQLSQRAHEPFVAVNMAAIPKDLIESELFGHEKGSFTGATHRKSGRFSQAARGTLFLDEIGDMPMDAQTRLLRVLQEGEYSPVGSTQTFKNFARIVCATHQDLAARVASGHFREDLFYRLQVVPIYVPALRERCEDIPALVAHFMARAANRGLPMKQLSDEAMAYLQTQRWYGNVRELEHVLYRICALTTDHMVDAKALQTILQSSTETARHSGGETAILSSIPAFLSEHLAQFFAAHLKEDAIANLYDDWMGTVEPPLLKATMEFTGKNQVKTAQILGINRNTLRKKLQQYGMLD